MLTHFVSRVAQRNVLTAVPPIHSLMPVFAVTALLFGATAAGAVSGGQGTRNFDARVAPNRQTEFPPRPEQLAAVSRLRASLPALSTTFDRTTGVTRSVYNPVGFLTARDFGVGPETIAVDYVRINLFK